MSVMQEIERLGARPNGRARSHDPDGRTPWVELTAEGAEDARRPLPAADWLRFSVRSAAVKADGAPFKSVVRQVTYRLGDSAEDHYVIEPIWPIAVPGTRPTSASDENKASASTDPVAFADAYWAKASDTARSTAKWMATIIGAALAALLGTAPLADFDDGVNWDDGVAVVAIGLVLLGVCLWSVIDVLVPGMTGFGDLMAAADRGDDVDDDRLLSAYRELAERAAAQQGVELPIGVGSLPELGHRLRIEELTLDELARQVACSSGPTAKRWGQVKLDRGGWLLHLQQQVTQWVILGAYAAVKVKTDRARTLGLAAGLLGALLAVIGYIDLRAGGAEDTPAETTYVVVDPGEGAAADLLGDDCTVFTAVPIATGSERTTLFVNGGEDCNVDQRVELDSADIVAVEPASEPAEAPTPQ